ncbi:MAG: polysaccharide biosynthesis protein [Clostridiales bacterium]|nr:polysaccharide biosynthesis protein [Clostridiales bacterium]
MAKKAKNLFLSGVFILSISNIIIKVIGLMFKIPLTNIIGDSGMGYFNSAYTIYVWFYMISTAGLPVAVSIMISEARAKGNLLEVKRIYKVTMGLFLLIGAAGTAVMMLGAGGFASLIGNDGARLSILAIAPTLFFICISSAIRGYFQGYQYMVPTAISQLIEAAGKLIFGILLASYAVSRFTEQSALPTVSSYAIFGLDIAVFLGMLYLIFAKFRFKSEQFDKDVVAKETGVVRSNGRIAATIAKIAIPVTISSSVMSLTNLIDLSIVMRRLQSIGLSQAMSNAVWGNYSSLAVPMFNLPPVLIYPISYSLVPLLSGYFADGRQEKANKTMHSAIRISAIIIIPMALGLSVMAEPILKLLYNPHSAEMAAPLLSILALSVFFVGMIAITNAILQASGHEKLPILSMVAGAVVKIISSLILIGIPSIGIYGTPIGTFLCYMTTTIINFYYIAKYTGVVPKLVQTFLKPLAAGFVCCMGAYGTYFVASRFVDVSSRVGNGIATLAAIMIACILYLTLLLLCKGLDKEDICMLPKGNKIAGLLHKMRLM